MLAIGLVAVLIASVGHADEWLTLARALAIAAERSPRVAAAAARAQGAEGAAETAGRPSNPALELRTENWLPHGGGPLPDHFAVLSMPLPLSRRLGVARSLAASEATVASEDERHVRQRVAVDVAERFVSVLATRGLVAALQEQRAGLEEARRILHRRVLEGVVPGSDVAKVEAELGRLDLTTARAQLALHAEATRLGLALGTTDQISPATLVEPQPPRLPEAALDDALADALGRRADVAAARAQLLRAQQALALERARGIPDVVVAGGWKRTERSHTGVVGLSIPLPLSDRNESAIARATGEVEAAAREVAAVEAAARAEIASSLREARALIGRVGGADAMLVDPAEVVRRAARAALREGSGDVLRLVDAERVATEARREALELRLAAVLAAVRARVALGEEPID